MSDEEVRHPTRFRKGQSGNPKGRPRKPRTKRASAFDVVIDRTLTIVQDGKPREVTVDEALQQKTYLDAIAGNRPARREVLKMIAKREMALAEKPSQKRHTKLWDWVKHDPVDPSNADGAMLLLGIACRDPRWTDRQSGDRERLLLEPWAVKVALSRRAARRLDSQELDEARRCTRDADTLPWPDPAER